MKRALWVVVVAVGCGQKDAQDKPAPVAKAPETKPPEPPKEVTCADRAARLEKRLHVLAARTPGFMPIIKDVHAPESVTGQAFDERGFVLAVTRDGKILYDGGSLATVKDARKYLDARSKEALESIATAGGNLHDARWPLYVWADRDAPAGAVASIVGAAADVSNHLVPRLLVGGKDAQTSADAAEVDAMLTKLPAAPDDATKYLVDQMASSIGACKQIVVAMATSSMEGTDAQIADKLISELPKGLLECECKIPDPDGFELATHMWFGAWAPPLAWIDIPKIGKGDKQPIGALVK